MLINFEYFSSIISIFRRSNFVYHHLGCISIYRPLSYPLRSLQYKIPNLCVISAVVGGQHWRPLHLPPNYYFRFISLVSNILFLSLSFLQCSVDSKISNDVVRNYVVTMSFIFFKIIQNCINHHFGICSLNILKSLHI